MRLALVELYVASALSREYDQDLRRAAFFAQHLHRLDPSSSNNYYPSGVFMSGKSRTASITMPEFPTTEKSLADNDDDDDVSQLAETSKQSTDDYFHGLADDIILSIADEFNWTSGAIGAAAAGGVMGLLVGGVWTYNRFKANGFGDQTESMSVYDSESILGADLDEFLN